MRLIFNAFVNFICEVSLVKICVINFNLLSDRLSLILAKERNHSQTYIGCMKKGPVFTDPNLKWLVLFRLCVFYLYDCVGAMFLISPLFELHY